MSNKKILAFLLFIPFLATSQVNIIVGYDLGIKNQQEVNFALARYNKENTLSKAMKPIKSMNGLDLGLSYRFSFLTIEGHSITRFKTVGAKETTPTGVLKEYAKISEQNFSVGGTINFDKFGIGTAWEQHSYRFARKFAGEKTFVEAFGSKLNYTTLNLFLDFQISMNKQLGFHARPYYAFPLQGDNISQQAVDNALSLTPRAVENPNTKWGYWGIKFLFFNGQQRN